MHVESRFSITAIAMLASLLPRATAAQVTGVTLEEAISLAVRSQPAIIQARGDVLLAQAERREAIGNWLPSLTGTSGWSTNSSQRFDQATQRTVNGASTSYSAGFNASLQIFDGFRRAAQSRASSAGATSADAALVNQRFQVALQTKRAFFSAVAADELVRVAETRVQRGEEQLKISKEKLAAGSAIRSDTLRGRVELGNAELQLLNAQTQRATAEADLARLVGLDGPVRALGDSSLYTLPSLDTAGLRQEALLNSPAIAQAEATAAAAHAQMGVSRSQYFPTVTASYSNSWAGSAVDQLNNSWTARLSLSWPIFNGFTRETSVARSLASRDAAEARADDARRQTNAELTQQFAALASASARIQIAEASREAAEEDSRVQRERYRLGAATILDVLTAQVNVDQVAVDAVEARHDFLVAQAGIETLIGRDL